MKNTNNIKLNQFSKELRLIILLLATEIDENNIKELLDDIDWNQFLKLTRHHRIYPLIYIKLKEFKDHRIPTQIIQTLYLECQKNTIRMLHLSGETEYIAGIFSKNNIRTLFLKGPTLAADLYGDISLRTSADLDVLIPLNKLAYAEELLLKMGYEKDDYILSILNDWKWRHHHITFFHPEKKIKVEIHWRLNPGPAWEPEFNEMWERRRRSRLISTPVFILGNEDMFLFLVSHGARHGWSRLRWLLDINLIEKLNLNWKNVIQLLRKYQYHYIGGQALILTRSLFNTNIPVEMRRITGKTQSIKLAMDALFYLRKMVNLHDAPIPEDIARFHKNHLFSLMSNKQKFLYILSFLYPFHLDSITLPLPKALHFLYFPLRPFLILWRKSRNHVALGGKNEI